MNGENKPLPISPGGTGVHCVPLGSCVVAGEDPVPGRCWGEVAGVGLRGHCGGWEEVREVPQIPPVPVVASAGTTRGQHRQHPCRVPPSSAPSAVTATTGETGSAAS